MHSGKYAATIGFPMKSGVSGGVLCTVQNGEVEQLKGSYWNCSIQPHD